MRKGWKIEKRPQQRWRQKRRNWWRLEMRPIWRLRWMRRNRRRKKIKRKERNADKIEGIKPLFKWLEALTGLSCVSRVIRVQILVLDELTYWWCCIPPHACPLGESVFEALTHACKPLNRHIQDINSLVEKNINRCFSSLSIKKKIEGHI